MEWGRQLGPNARTTGSAANFAAQCCLRAEGAGPRAAPGPPQHSPGEGGASSLSRCFSTQPMVTPEGTLCPGLADSVLLWPLGPAKSQLVNSQAQFLLLTTQ